MAGKHRRYSRIEKVEAQKARRSAFVYIALTIGLILLIFFYGIGILSDFSGFVSGLLGSNAPVAITDKTPPAPPRLEDLDDYTKDKDIDVIGVAEAGSLVTVSVNGIKKETVATKEGGFRLSFELVAGENEIIAQAKDTAGNVSNQSEPEIVILDTKAPEITIEMPGNGQTFSGGEKEIEIKGETNEDVDLKIAGKSVYVSSDYSFSTKIELTDGENVIPLNAVDRAGNSTETQITVNYHP